MQRQLLFRAVLTLVAAAASFAIVAVIAMRMGTSVQPGIVAAILAIGLMRRPTRMRGWGILTIPLVMVAIALGAAGVGSIFHLNLIAGAVVFTVLLAGSIWIRKFGERWRRIGELLALPMVVMLVVPPPGRAPGGPLVDLALLVAAGVVPLAFAAVLSRLLPAVPEVRSERRDRPGIAPTTRIAAQLAVSLAGAFVIGIGFFPSHWAWVVLTAFLVSSGSLGREHAVYFGILRLGGALAGTIVAGLTVQLVTVRGIGEAALIFGVLFIGIWLREVNYAIWAACITIILALLAPPEAGSPVAFLSTRLFAMLIGAACAVAAAWLVYPIRTLDILRLRLAEYLAEVDRVVAGSESAPGHVAHRFAEVQRVAAPIVWHGRIFGGRRDGQHPAEWAAHARSIHAAVRDLESGSAGSEQRRAAIRRAIGLSRLSIANHGKTEPDARAVPVSDALRSVQKALAPPV